MANTFIIKEGTANRMREGLSVTPDTFNANVRYFLHQLLDDPVNARIPNCVRMAGVSKPRFIRMMIKRGILSRSERIENKETDNGKAEPVVKVKYSVLGKVPDELEYKIPKNDFDRNVEKLRIDIFERNLPERKKRESGQNGNDFSDILRENISETLGNDRKNSQYRDLGGGFDVVMDNGMQAKSLITIQNKQTGTMYHICFDGANFDICRDMQDGQPCSHVSYVFDNLLDAFNNNGYVNVNEGKKKTEEIDLKIFEND